MGNKSLPGSVDVQLKFYSQVKTSLKKGGRGGAPPVLLCLHPPGDMSQGTQKTNHENKCVCMCTYMSAKSEKHLSTHFVPMGQKGNNMAPAGRMWGFADSVAMGVQFCGRPGEG